MQMLAAFAADQSATYSSWQTDLRKLLTYSIDAAAPFWFCPP
tara:strand:+ start:1107 stop:1232 length:126 start_codon:yes stop_codon:yes gene_type:complete